MDHQEILAQLRKMFFYQSDGRLDTWTVTPGPGPVRGDCDDFALALAFRLAGQSWWRFIWHLVTFKSVIWHCKTRAAAAPHAVLWHRGAGWADNIFPTWAPGARHKRLFPWFWPLALGKLAISPLLGWINRTVKRAKDNEGG